MLCLTCDGTVSNNTFDGNIYVPLKTILIMTRIKNYRFSRHALLYQRLHIFLDMTSGTY